MCQSWQTAEVYQAELLLQIRGNLPIGTKEVPISSTSTDDAKFWVLDIFPTNTNAETYFSELEVVAFFLPVSIKVSFIEWLPFHS